MSGQDRASAWVEHLRSGGTTRWRVWAGILGPSGETLAPPDDSRSDSTGPAGPRLPGAQRLEVLRRLNEIGAVPPLLVDAVLLTTSLGRGQQERQLVAGGPEAPFGAPPVAPSQIPDAELRRVATGALADLARRAEPTPPTRASRLARLRPTRVRLVGPWLASAYADQLAALGRPPGGRDPEVAVLLAPLDLVMADLWARRVLDGGRVRWSPWLERHAGAHRLPERADAAVVAARWAGRVGPDRVHLVTSASGLVELTGRRSLTPPRRLSHAAVEAARATSTLLHLALPEDQLGGVLRGVVGPWLTAADRPDRPHVGWLPPEARDWLAREATRVRDQLRVAGYPVLGEGGPEVVVPDPATPPERLSDGAVLDVLLVALHRGARAVEDQTEGGPG